MSVINKKYKISYFPVPKIACSSLKNIFFEIENDFEFRRFNVNGEPKNIHSFYFSESFLKAPHDQITDHKKFCVVRDPIFRTISCYRNRVIHHKALSSKVVTPDLQRKGIYPNPSLDDFCLNIELYREISNNIRHHTEPITFFLGMNPSYFDKIYSIQDIEVFFDDLSLLTNKKITPHKKQTEGPSLGVEDMSSEAREKIVDFYKEDYQIYGSYF